MIEGFWSLLCALWFAGCVFGVHAARHTTRCVQEGPLHGPLQRDLNSENYPCNIRATPSPEARKMLQKLSVDEMNPSPRLEVPDLASVGMLL